MYAKIFFKLVAAALLSASFLAAATPAGAQTAPVNMTTTAVPFLTITPDARSGGMGDMGLATAPGNDAYSGAHNGAKTPFATEGSSIGVTYTPWLRDLVQDMYLLSAAGYHQLDEHEALSASVRYFSLGNVPISDYNGNKLSTSNPREYSFDLGYSRKLSERLGLGLTARYIYSNLGTGGAGGVSYKGASAVSADVSLYYNGLDKEKGQGWTGGLVVSNLGSGINYTGDAGGRDFLPANLGAGVGYRGVANEDNKWMLSGEVNKSLVPLTPTSSDSAGEASYHTMGIVKSWGKSFSDNAYQYSVGGEYGYKDEFFVRLGYVVQTMEEGVLKYVTSGVGLRYSSMGLDFSYLAPSGNGTTRSPLSNTFRLEIVFRWK
jgi:Type IX secretion system protein PorV